MGLVELEVGTELHRGRRGAADGLTEQERPRGHLTGGRRSGFYTDIERELGLWMCLLSGPDS